MITRIISFIVKNGNYYLERQEMDFPERIFKCDKKDSVICIIKSPTNNVFVVTLH